MTDKHLIQAPPIEKPRHAVGTEFNLQTGRTIRMTKVVGYHVEWDTDTNECCYTYNVQQVIAGQKMRFTVPRSTVDRAIVAGIARH